VNVTGVDAVTFGVKDVEEARRFWADFGLTPVDVGVHGATFRTLNEATVSVRRSDDPALPRPIESGSSMREVVWGVRSSRDLETIGVELSKDRSVSVDPDGTLHSVDPQRVGIAFRVTRCKPVQVADPEFNMPGRPGRINKRGKFYKSAQPAELTHVVFMVDKLEQQRSFYVDRLGFKISDSYPGRGYFTRGSASHAHHNLFLLNVGGRVGFHHAAFEVANVHELFGGGLNMTRKGWKTMLGPGRHPISSCYFWYFHSPSGGAAEYDFDSDYVDEHWQGAEHASSPEVFAEWCLAEGMEESLLYKGIQTGGVKS
jgi:catechol 2,3-dioxygenase-like lactoylglutathione lyase family enzyme